MDLDHERRFAIHDGGIRIEPGALDVGTTALLLIDMQYLDAHPDFGQGREAQDRNVFDEQYGYYYGRLPAVIENQERLSAGRRFHGRVS